MNILIKSYSVESLGKRKRERVDFVRTISDNEIRDFKKKKISTEVENLYDKIMSIQIINTINRFAYIGNNNYFLPFNKIYDYFDGNNEIKYFLDNVHRFGFELLGYNNTKTKIYFKKINDDYLQKIINNSLTTRNDNFIFSFNHLKRIFSWNYVLNLINNCPFFRIIKYDKYLGVIVFTLV